MLTKPQALFSWSTSLEFGSFWVRNLIACDKYSIHFCCSLSKFEPSKASSPVLAIGKKCLFRHGNYRSSFTNSRLVGGIDLQTVVWTEHVNCWCRNGSHWQKSSVPCGSSLEDLTEGSRSWLWQPSWAHLLVDMCQLNIRLPKLSDYALFSFLCVQGANWQLMLWNSCSATVNENYCRNFYV